MPLIKSDAALIIIDMQKGISLPGLGRRNNPHTELNVQRLLETWLDPLRQVLNRELYLGIREFEAQYAHYPVGAFYKTHVDRHRDSNARVISAVCYLNPDWPAGAGGDIVMYDGDGRELFRQAPTAGTLVLFRSADMPHEVLPATQERWSIAGWFRTRA